VVVTEKERETEGLQREQNGAIELRLESESEGSQREKLKDDGMINENRMRWCG